MLNRENFLLDGKVVPVLELGQEDAILIEVFTVHAGILQAGENSGTSPWLMSRGDGNIRPWEVAQNMNWRFGMVFANTGE